jgi:NhaP-type Na+/H+ or K+/H+ antiporter
VSQAEVNLAVVAGCFVAWGLAARRLERLQVSAPLAFVVMGLLVAHGPWAVVHVALHSSTLEQLAEVTLAVVLFSDASRVNLHALRADLALPGRLLCIGLPLTIAAATGAAVAIYGPSGWWIAAAIGAIVAPTDAALGAGILVDERVPVRIRRVLNVESGLNDGIATPFVNLFLVGAASAATAAHEAVRTAATEIAGGLGLGIGFGVLAAVVVTAAVRRGWASPSSTALALLGLAVCTYATALVAGVNGFIAAFVGGLCFGSLAKLDDGALERYTEESGSLLSLLVWFFFGAAMLVPGLETAGWKDVAFGVLALTVVRMVPVAIALVGAGLDRATVAFVGWFGPRGLASIIFGLIAVDQLSSSQGKVLVGAVATTVGLSVLLHGVTASPLAERYARHVHRLDADRPEHAPTATLSARTLRVPTRGTGAGS